MFVRSGAVGDYFFAFWDLIDIGGHDVDRYVDRALDVLFLV